MTTISITNEHGTYSVSADTLTCDEYIRLFVAAMIAASFDYKTITDAIVEFTDELNE